MKIRVLASTVLCVFGVASFAFADDWPQWRGPNRDGVWNETRAVDRFTSPEIQVKWRTPIASGYCGPTVADGRVYVMDYLTKPTQTERVHCLDWKTGQIQWSYQYACQYGGIGYQAGPRASVLIDARRAYSLGATGYLICFDAGSGTVHWEQDLRREYQIRMPNWGIASSPIVEGDLLIVQIGGADGACLIALDKSTGQLRWKALDDDASYSAPIVITQAGRRVLVCWTGDRIVGVDPGDGSLCWSYPFPWEKWPIGIATPVVRDDLLLISEAHKGTLLLRLRQDRLAVEKVWHRRKEELPDEAALHCLISTPQIVGDYIYGADNSGIVRCLRLDTGHQVWEDGAAVPENRWATIHLIRNGRRTWLFNERGELIIARLTPEGFEEIDRARLIDPTLDQLRRRGGVTWSHPAFAYGHVFARNDKEIICADLSAGDGTRQQ